MQLLKLHAQAQIQALSLSLEIEILKAISNDYCTYLLKAYGWQSVYGQAYSLLKLRPVTDGGGLMMHNLPATIGQGISLKPNIASLLVMHLWVLVWYAQS